MTILRSKWNLLSTKLSASELAERLAKESFYSGALFGFEVLSFKNNLLTVSYHEEYEHVDSYFDPFGSEKIVKSVRYKFLKVYLRFLGNGQYLVQLENLPRTSISFYKNLNIVIGSNLSVSDVKFDVESLLDRVSNSGCIRQFKIKQASFSSIYLNEKSRAKLEITSTKNALNEFNASFDYKKYVLDKVKCDFRMDNENLYLELRKTGVISHSKNLVNFLTELILEELQTQNMKFSS
ncbi:hypothetical protein DDN98_13230 [Vibrio cholerae]|nr:hypothetical protein [Vibrio cholerae]EGR4211333.1 hypothetical protein [Vibrio cholerae]EGR4294746.1 hypothetical protein [Vibrio cholerae]EGR4298639.1 hypothetical protein [Vibrio cholerae]EGZ6882600.1 hypothetical protein [Vibrio cholerae]MBG8950116.1 hypothetical protein [Vibrio cholerae]